MLHVISYDIGTTGFIQLSNGQAVFNDEVTASKMHILGDSIFEGEMHADSGTFENGAIKNATIENAVISKDCQIFGNVGTVTDITGKTFNYGEQDTLSIPPMGEFSEIVLFYSKEKGSSEYGYVEHNELLGMYLISWYVNFFNFNRQYQRCNLTKIYEPITRSYASVTEGITGTQYVRFSNPSTNANNCMLSHIRLN